MAKIPDNVIAEIRDRVDLVEGLRDALQNNQPIDHLFSRKRSFKRGIKKRRKAEGTWPKEDDD